MSQLERNIEEICRGSFILLHSLDSASHRNLKQDVWYTVFHMGKLYMCILFP